MNHLSQGENNPPPFCASFACFEQHKCNYSAAFLKRSIPSLLHHFSDICQECSLTSMHFARFFFPYSWEMEAKHLLLTTKSYVGSALLSPLFHRRWAGTLVWPTTALRAALWHSIRPARSWWIAYALMPFSCSGANFTHWALWISVMEYRVWTFSGFEAYPSLYQAAEMCSQPTDGWQMASLRST